MSRETVLARAQSAAAQGMVETCTVKRVATSVADPDTGVVTPTYTTVYAGPCKVRQRVPRANPATVGEATLFEARLELHIPVTVTGVASDDIATITTAKHDQDLVGRVFHIRELAHATYLSARRFSMLEVTS